MFVDYQDIRSSSKAEYNWDLGNCFGLGDGILEKISSNQIIMPKEINALYLATNTLDEENRMLNTSWKTRVPIKNGELSIYVECLRVLSFRSLKTNLTDEDHIVLKNICMDFSAFWNLYQKDRELSTKEYNQLTGVSKLRTGEVDPYKYVEANKEAVE